MGDRQFRRTGDLPVAADVAFAWHLAPGALVRLAPPFPRVTVEREPPVVPGALGLLRVRRGPVSLRWEARITEVDRAARRFVDVQERGPFAAWRHEHRIEATGDAGTSRIVDEIHWRAPLGALGERLAPRLVERALARAFAWRHRVTQHDLALHARYALPRLRIGITGASGFIGARLAAVLTTGGHEVVRFVRRAGRDAPDQRWDMWRARRDAPDQRWDMRSAPRDASEVRWDTQQWDPAASAGDRATLEGLDAVIHLAGESIAALRWTAAKKARIAQSRVQGSRTLVAGLRSLARPPRVFLAVSAVGAYGGRGDEVLTEESPLGAGFLADTCRAWEAETSRAADFARVVQLRLAVVLDPAGGALAAMAPAFRAGLGGPLAGGGAWFPWVALDDVLAAFVHALATDGLSGPVIVAAPGEVRQGDFARALGRALRRPACTPAPRFALRALVGRDLADEALLASVRAQPARLIEGGFRFAHPELDGALAHALATLV